MTSVAVGHTKQPFFFYFVACMIYLVMSIVSSFGISAIERWSERGERGGARRRRQRAVAGMNLDLLAALWPEAPGRAARHDRARGDLVVLGVLLAIPIAAARLSRNRVVGALAFAYVYFFRGTPLLAQLFLIYYGAGQFVASLKAIGLWGFFRDAFNCAVLAFALNTAAYQAEIFRGAIRSVPRGQWEAARALGLHALPLLWKVVLPQAAIVALRPLGNEIILHDQGVGGRQHRHRVRPDGRDAARLLAQLRSDDLPLRRGALPDHGGGDPPLLEPARRGG